MKLARDKQQLAKRNKERQQQVKERHAELEAEKHKQFAENEQRLQLADDRYEKRVNDIRMKAKAQGEKVEEFLFVREAGTENRKALLEGKLSETSVRRKALLDQKQKQADMLGQRSEMAEKRRIALQEEQKAKLLLQQQRREDAEQRRKEFIDQRRVLAEGTVQKAALVSERKKQLYDEVMDLYSFLCKGENLWEYLESGLQRDPNEESSQNLTPFERVKRRLMHEHLELVSAILIW